MQAQGLQIKLCMKKPYSDSGAFGTLDSTPFDETFHTLEDAERMPISEFDTPKKKREATFWAA